MILSAVATLIIGYIIWYITLIPINAQSVEFWIYVFTVLILFMTLVTIERSLKEKSTSPIIYSVPCMIGLIIIVLLVFSSTLFNSKEYSKMLKVTNGDFTDDVKEIPLDNIPVIDRVTAIKLGDRKMGAMVDMASQFNVSDAYTQIDFQDKPIRVTPLEYNGIFKWLNNKADGIPGYITVDMTSGETKLHRLDKKIRYSKSDKFGRDIKRHLRKQYLTKIFYDVSFEIDEKGCPYWIAPTYKSTIGVFGGKDVDTVIAVNALDGSIEEWNVSDAPTWIDRIYDADKIIKQINNWGRLKNGFKNSLISQNGVLIPTEGYNYLAIEDDVFLYTGITSASDDSSNVGFILTNLRNKETKFYEVSSADESSAMSSAEGEVQEKEYLSTFPILLNIEGKPTYMMALKDNAELIKNYALVDAENYQKVSVGSTVEQTLFKHVGDINLKAKENINTMNIMVEGINSAVVNGYTQYYIKSNQDVFIADIKINKELPFLRVKDILEIEYYIDKEQNNRIDKIEMIKE